MKVQLTQQVSIDQLREKITQQFPNYECFMRNSKMLVVKKSGTAAAVVMIRGQKVFVTEQFGTMGGQMVFGVSCILLGVIIPLAIYYSAFYAGQKTVRNEVAEFV